MRIHAGTAGALIAALGVTAALALAPPASAETAAGEASFSTSFASRYVWRGQTLSKGFVAQPSVEVAIGGFSANIWNNVDLDNDEADDDGIVMNESDLLLSYTATLGPVEVTGGIVHYAFEGGDTQEVFLTGTLATLLNPALRLYYDIDDGDGGFAELAVSQAVPVGPLSLSAGAALGFNLGNTAMGMDADGGSFNGLYYGEVSLATSIPLFGVVTLDPRVAYSTALGDDGKTAIEALSVDGKKSMFYGSIAVTAAF